MSRTETEPVRQIVNLPRLGALVALILLVAGGAYWFGANSVRLKEVPALWALGMDQPSENRLDPKFRDADANLVADPPADEADWLDPPVLTFSYLATDQDQYEEVWSEVLKSVGERCGRTVEFRRQESPDTQLAGLDNGVLHIAGINSGAVPVAVNQSGFIPLCSFGADGKLALYAMKVITRKDSPIQTVSDLRGRRVALTDPTSNSGWKAPLHLLKSKHDMTPILDYDIVATGGHANSIKAIAAGEQEVAAVASDELLLAQARGEISEADYRVIFESEPFPNNTIGCTHRLKPELVDSVKRALLEFKWDDSRLATQFSTIGAKQFVEVSFKDDFGLLREIDDAMGRRTREMLGRKF